MNLILSIFYWLTSPLRKRSIKKYTREAIFVYEKAIRKLSYH